MLAPLSAALIWVLLWLETECQGHRKYFQTHTPGVWGHFPYYYSPSLSSDTPPSLRVKKKILFWCASSQETFRCPTAKVLFCLSQNESLSPFSSTQPNPRAQAQDVFEDRCDKTAHAIPKKWTISPHTASWTLVVMLSLDWHSPNDNLKEEFRPLWPHFFLLLEQRGGLSLMHGQASILKKCASSLDIHAIQHFFPIHLSSCVFE